MLRSALRISVCSAALALGCAGADNPPPQPTGVVPASVPHWTGTRAQVQGQDFYGAARIELGADDAVNINRGYTVAIDGAAVPSPATHYISTARIDIDIPPLLAFGMHAVSVTSPSGLTGALRDAFSVDDCSDACGDGACCIGAGEPVNCPADCTGTAGCGDGVCNGTETTATCPLDCPASVACGDDVCDAAAEGADVTDAATDTTVICSADCHGCGDGVCDAATENRCTCPQDCGVSTCGDGICCAANGETTCTCPTDCTQQCGDGCCNGTETAASCMVDCPGDTVASADSYIRQQFPTENHGFDMDIRAGSGSTNLRANRALLRFDVFTITCNVSRATLLLYYWGEDFTGVSPVLEVHRVTRAWTEASVTWARASTMTPWTTPGGDFDPAIVASATLGASVFGWVQWDITSLVQAWLSGTVNNGMILLEPNDGQGGNGRKLFYSREETDITLRPDLVVRCGP
jgi:hypothetical protein